MPEFKLNGKTYSGSTSYASAIDYTEADGSKTTVQDKISEMDENLSKQNKKIELKNISFSLISDSGGNIGFLSFVPQNAQILNVEVTTSSICAIPFKINGIWYAKVLNLNSPMIVQPGVNVDGIVEYIEL